MSTGSKSDDKMNLGIRASQNHNEDKRLGAVGNNRDTSEMKTGAQTMDKSEIKQNGNDALTNGSASNSSGIIKRMKTLFKF